MLVLTEAVYLPLAVLSGTNSLMGSDYEMLHRWRLAFARQALFGARQEIPAWNPHEVLGAPFAANLQSFPWIPTRLVLLLFDPSVAFGVGVGLAAALAALFTYLYCRRAGLTIVGAAAAGWTFASAGFFSSRVMAGHLPLLEAYPALPLLLWLVDRALAPTRGLRHQIDLVILAVCCACVVAAGHPQIPAYALAAAFLYVAWKGRGVGRAVRAHVAAAMALGIGMAMAAWWPMLQLIGRSTRIQHLAAPDNDVLMSYSRLLALVLPGIDGWADPVALADRNPFLGYPNNSWFWDTASYVGILPLVAILALLIACVVQKRLPDWRGKYLSFLGVAALLCSLPLANSVLHAIPGTFLRSPARVLYLSTFCAAVALGAGLDLLSRATWLRSQAVKMTVIAVLLAVHYVDLRGFSHLFVQSYPRDTAAPAFQNILDHETGSGRIAEEREDDVLPYEERYDDAGGFDSIFLARFNRGYVALAGLPADTNEQLFDASVLPVKALEALGVRFVITEITRTDLEQTTRVGDVKLYRVHNPAPRAQFFAADRVEFLPQEKIPDAFANGSWDRLLLEQDARRYVISASGPQAGGLASVDYPRASSDEMIVRSGSEAPGFVYVLEAYDPGWSATVDRAPATVIPANGFAMAIPVAAGRHVVRLRYETPGQMTGIAVSLVSLCLLAALSKIRYTNV